MDGEFEKLKDIMPTVECNTTTAKEHVSKVEHLIRTGKELIRGLIGMLPFDNIQQHMKIKFVYCIVLWLNAFLMKTGVLTPYSLWELLLVHWRLDYNDHYWVLTGTFCKVHDEPSPSNTMVP
jgi:hypothetical protein